MRHMLNWMQRAACRGQNPDWWFQENGKTHDALRAVKICQVCPVKAECLADALVRERTNGDRWGIWGGLTATERAELVRRGRIQKRVA